AGSIFGVTKAGVGRLLLSGANTYRGLTTVNEGTLNISNPSALGTADNGTTVGTNATLQVQGSITIAEESLVLNGARFINLTGDNVWQGPVTLAQLGIIELSAGTLTISGVI